MRQTLLSVFLFFLLKCCQFFSPHQVPIGHYEAFHVSQNFIHLVSPFSSAASVFFFVPCLRNEKKKNSLFVLLWEYNETSIILFGVVDCFYRCSDRNLVSTSVAVESTGVVASHLHCLSFSRNSFFIYLLNASYTHIFRHFSLFFVVLIFLSFLV